MRWSPALDPVQDGIDRAVDVGPLEGGRVQPTVEEEPFGESEQDRGQRVGRDLDQFAGAAAALDQGPQHGPLAGHGGGKAVTDGGIGGERGPHVGAQLNPAGVGGAFQQLPDELAELLGGRSAIGPEGGQQKAPLLTPASAQTSSTVRSCQPLWAIDRQAASMSSWRRADRVASFNLGI
jgi:hypothetical protein